jgi:hypothetical protein
MFAAINFIKLIIMKNLLNLGTPLTKEAQKSILGGNPELVCLVEFCWINGQPALCEVCE